MRNPFSREPRDGDEVTLATTVIGCWELVEERVETAEPTAWIDGGELHPDRPSVMASREITEPANSWFSHSLDEYNAQAEE
jgi:hypothetical protein